MTYIILLIVIIAELAVLIYFNFKKLPVEVQHDIQRKVAKTESKVLEWEVPESAESKTSKKLTEEITK